MVFGLFHCFMMITRILCLNHSPNSSMNCFIIPILKNDEAVLQDEDINVFVDALGESSVVLGARAWTKNEDFWSAKWRILEEIKEQLDAHHISIPYQQLMVHMAESQK